MHLAIPRLGDYCNVLIQDEHGRMHHLAWAHVDPEQEAVLRDLAISLMESPPPGDFAFSATVMKRGSTMLMSCEALAAAVAGIARANPAQAELLTKLRPVFLHGRAVVRARKDRWRHVVGHDRRVVHVVSTAIPT